jgi:hypothetical protein
VGGRSIHALAAIAAALIGVAAEAALALSIRAVAIKGDPAPGDAPAPTFFGFDEATLNDRGEVAFRAWFAVGASYGTQVALYGPDGSGGIRLVARTHAQAPGVEAGTHLSYLRGDTFYAFALDERGELAFSGGLGPPGSTSSSDWAIWRSAPGSPSPLVVARQGMPVPGLPGATFAGWRPNVASNDAGDLAFAWAFVTASGVSQAVFRSEAEGALTTALRSGDMVPGSGGAAFQRCLHPAAVDASGNVGCIAEVLPNPVTGYDRTLLAPGADGDVRVAARTGDPVPGAAPGARYTVLDYGAEFNQAGDVAYPAYYSGPGGSGSGVFVSEADAGARAVILEGQAVPGGGGLVFASPPNEAVEINASGEVSFRASVRDPATGRLLGAVFGPDGAGGIRLVAKAGDPVPDALGVSFRNLMAPSPHTDLNDHGEVVFRALLSDGGQGVFFAAPGEAPTTVARTGIPIEIAPGDLRTPTWLDLAFTVTVGGAAYWPDWDRRSINDAHQVLFSAYFSDGTSGLFLASIPEPETGLLLMLGLSVVAVGRRARSRARRSSRMC